MEYTSKMTVTNEKTAQSCGSGDMPVLATPFLTAVMENAAMHCLAPTLAQGVTTVGVEINVKHLAPSAVGSEISATATLIKTDGRS
ncbi:MAG: hotdog domain-containing protein, partial [Oscillospiraceae bacterium]